MTAASTRAVTCRPGGPAAAEADYTVGMTDQSATDPPRLTGGPITDSPLTDSPWFWGLLFAVMALAGIGLIAPKFDVRQRQVEGRYLGRDAAAQERARRSAGLDPVDLADSARDREEAQPGRIVPLWTLALGSATAAAACGFMLWRERRRPFGPGFDRP